MIDHFGVTWQCSWIVKNDFFRLHISGLPGELEDVATDICFQYDCQGVSESLDFKQLDLRYEPVVVSANILNLDAYFLVPPPYECLERLQALSPSVKTDVLSEENKDWLEEWKKGFESFELVSGIWVVPSWKEPVAEAKHMLWIDPGMAFGTGTHATTQLASQLISSRALQGEPIDSVLDVGTGTGILALVAEYYGAKKVVGLEIDPVARDVARENLIRNNSTHIEILDHLVEDETGSYDLVIVNIIDGVILDLKEHLYRVTKPGGSFVLSGILSERLQAFKNEFFSLKGLSLVEHLSKGEWEALWIKRD